MAQTSFDDFLQHVPVSDLAAKFGVDEATLTSAVRQASSGLLGGMAVQAQDEASAQKLVQAAKQHPPVAGTLKLEAIDENDGEKIVGHVLGSKKDDVVQALDMNAGGAVQSAAGSAGGGGLGGLIAKLLPILAPIIMQFIAGNLGKSSGSATDSTGSSDTGALGDLLGGLLGGGSDSSQSGGGLGDILGGLLGGGRSSGQTGGGLGDLLGGILGGKR